MKRNRQRAYLSGRRAERIACWLLRLKGYRILAVNWRCPVGEVDILARRGTVLAAIEVKRRSAGLIESESAGDAALFAISPHQQARVARAAEVFASRRSDCQGLELRLDAITVTEPTSRLLAHLARVLQWGWPRHFPAAWQAEIR
ncbi:YraN family protein [Dongia deserti]|uniref:YraN family protein n=1 Tax=Dongia deserti TaxID=2268030 RepID=UPI002548D582|nr:YraN family protein [Dongia deserti]